jgi:hypothetical protein
MQRLMKALRKQKACERTRSKGEEVMMQHYSLLLGVGIGLFCALAILTARYVAVVLGG